MKTISILVALFFSMSVFADVIIPKEDFGQFVVEVPDLSSKTEYNVSKYRIGISSGKKSKEIIPGEIYDILAGDACVTVRSNPLPVAKQCGISIKPNQLTTVRLAALAFDWDETIIKVDIGLKAQVGFRFVGPIPTSLVPLINLSTSLKKIAFIVLPIEFDAQYINPDIMKGQLFKIMPVPLQLNILDITPEDKRAELRLIHLDERLYIPATYNYAAVIIRNIHLSSAPDIIRGGHHPLSVVGRRDSTNVIHSQMLKTYENELNLHVYPLSLEEEKKYRMEFVVNNVLRVLKPEALTVTKLSIKTFDISDFLDKGPGHYKIFQLDPLNEDNFSLVKELKKPVSGSYTLRSIFRPTSTSFDLPMGWKYRFDFYIEDDLGHMSLEDQAELDLR